MISSSIGRISLRRDGHMDASGPALSALLSRSMKKSKHKLNSWFTPRGYLHFDRAVSRRFVESFLGNPTNVVKHSFFPFISYTKSTPRYCPETHTNESKDREIAYASHLDSQIYAYYASRLAEALELVYSNEALTNNVLAYRAIGKCNIDFANEAFSDVVRLSPCVALAFDVSGFFDNLDHGLLKNAWCELVGTKSLPGDHYAVYKSITKFATVERDAVYAEFGLCPNARFLHTERICSPSAFRDRIRGKQMVTRNPHHFGIPQGSPISAVLSNAYMLEFDRRMVKLAAEVGGVYRRYSDDILWICPNEFEQKVTATVDDYLAELKLKANFDKTERSAFSGDSDTGITSDRPLQYLGFTFDGRRMLIRSQTLARFYRRMKYGVRSAARAAKKYSSPKIFRRELYERFSHLGRRNFVNYAKRAEDRMCSEAIRKQLKPHWPKLHAELDKYAGGREKDIITKP